MAVNTLANVRARFVTLSGRDDLVNADASDNGANQFIVEGQRLLETWAPYPGEKRWYKSDIAAGDILLTMERVRSVLEVWVADADGRYPVELVPLRDLREVYYEPSSEISQNTPAFAAIAQIGLAPAQDAITSANYTDTFTYDYEDILFADEGDHWERTGIVWMPPADDTYTMSVLGTFFETELSADADKNYWTDVRSDILLYASLYVLESQYRNTEGAADWHGHLTRALRGLGVDHYRQRGAKHSRMRG